MQNFTWRATAIATTLLLASEATIARSQTSEEFYKGRQLSMIVFTGAGSTYESTRDCSPVT